MTENGKECGLCGRPVTDGEDFCSFGCKTVSRNLDNGEARVGKQGGSDDKERAEDDRDETFLRVDGMHSVTCEEFLEEVASEIRGVHEAEASYVTETVRVVHDTDELPEKRLRDALTTMGYTAYLRGDTDKGENDKKGTVRRKREVAGIRSRRDDHMLEARRAIGVVFGVFLLVPYAAMAYPGYLSSFIDIGILHYFDGFGLGDSNSLFFLRIYFVLTGVVLYFTAMPLLQGAYTGLRLGRPNADLVVSLTVVSAYVYGTVAALAGRNDIYYDLTIVVSSVVIAAVFYENSMKERAFGMLTGLTSSQVNKARPYGSEAGSDAKKVPIEEIQEGDTVFVREGERVPVDGVLRQGRCTVDESVVTGESLPVTKAEGDKVIGGSVVVDGVAVVLSKGGKSSISRLTSDVWDVQSADHGAQRGIDRIASVVFPIVFVVGLVAGLGHFFYVGSPAESFLVTLTVFVVGSPWGIGLAAPVSVGYGIREAIEDYSIAVFDETVFERLRSVDTVVFDKTGTLTTGEMEIIEYQGSQEVAEAAGTLETFSSHPVGEAIADEFGDGGKDIEDFETLPTGVFGKVEGRDILVGNVDTFSRMDWTVPTWIHRRAFEATKEGRLPVVAGKGGKAETVFVLGDRPKEGWEKTVTELDERGTEVIILTGDSQRATEAFESHDSVDRTFAEVPPRGKREAIRLLSSDSQNEVAMVGDGTNDALALAEADFGISMGGGTALASDAADLAVADDDVSTVATAFSLSEGVGRRFSQNVWLSFAYNVVTVPLALFGYLNPLFVIAAAVSTISLVVLNSTRSFLEE